MTEEIEPTTKTFNPLLAKMERIHRLKVTIMDFRLNSMFIEIFHCLVSWRNELEKDLCDDDRKQCDTFEKNIRNNNQIFLSHRSQGMEYPVTALTNYERLLWRLENKAGLSGENVKEMID